MASFDSRAARALQMGDLAAPGAVARVTAMARRGTVVRTFLACALSPLFLVVAACSTFGDARTEKQDRAAQVYEAVLHWFVPSVPEGEKAVIFIEPRGEGTSIGLSVQSELVRAFDAIAQVRFIDTEDEAIDKDNAGVPHVKDGGLLLRLGPVPETGSPVSVDVDQFIGVDTYASLRFVVGEVGDSWAVNGQPESVTTSVTTGG